MQQDFSFLRDLRFTVIGANGFIGTNLCLELLSHGAKVKGCGRTALPRKELAGNIDWIQLDWTKDNDNLFQAVENTDVIVHLVSTLLPSPSNLDPTRDVQENLISTMHLLEFCSRARLKKFVFASSGGTVYGPQKTMPIKETTLPNPISSYGIVKATIENYLNLYRHLHGLDYVALRIANPFGKYQMPHDQGLVANLMWKALAGKAIDIWGDGSIVRDYIHINSVVQAIMLSANIKNILAPRIYNIGSGIGRSVNEVLHSIQAVHGSHLKVNYTPSRPADVPENILDISLAGDHLNWAPKINWNNELVETYDWMSRTCE
jgi:UDP-glucose 4-epimerase